jgi:hypothetical protein
MMKEGKKYISKFLYKNFFENRIHPRDKWDVGYRLSRSGLAVAYGYKGIPYQGPVISDIVVAPNSAKINVTYSKEMTSSIELRNPGGFEVCLIFIYFINLIKMFCRCVVKARMFAIQMIYHGYQL